MTSASRMVLPKFFPRVVSCEDFDPDQSAFYYVRVLEIPKPSWQAYDAKYFEVEMSDEVPMTVQDDGAGPCLHLADLL